MFKFDKEIREAKMLKYVIMIVVKFWSRNNKFYIILNCTVLITLGNWWPCN